jgi:hypothetical protein
MLGLIYKGDKMTNLNVIVETNPDIEKMYDIEIMFDKYCAYFEVKERIPLDLDKEQPNKVVFYPVVYKKSGYDWIPLSEDDEFYYPMIERLIRKTKGIEFITYLIDGKKINFK